jgi:tRNA(Ile)-lysidine synthase
VHPSDPIEAVNAIPAGAWAIGVSGGVDSIALLELAHQRSDLQLHIAHLDHETRGGGSAEDAQFVAELAARWKLPVNIARRSEIEVGLEEMNTSARYRAARLTLFRRVVAAHQLTGVLLAHHFDDQAETILQRLLRGSGPAGLCGMPAMTTINGLLIRRPMLGVRKADLRRVLLERGIAWREDASNASPNQQRNRLRPLLARQPEIAASLVELADASRAMIANLREMSPALPASFDVSQLHDLPAPLARESARRWLSEQAGAHADITPAAIDRLVHMAVDAASPPRQHFPGKLLVRRKSGRISASPAEVSPAESPRRRELC